MLLTDHLYQSDYDKIKMKAAFFGVDLDSKVNEGKKKEGKEMKKEDFFTFKDPEEYKGYSVEERKKITEKMMTSHKQWADGKLKK